jgi:hypothetical protein
LALAFDSGTRPEDAVEAEVEDAVEVEVEEDVAADEAAAGGTAGPLGQIMNPTRTKANSPRAVAAMTFVRFSLPIVT